jgi:hypothetical protein
MSLPSSPDKLPPVRTIGVLALVLGLVFFYQSIYQPISDAASHKPTISVWGKGAFIVPGLLAFGITYTVFGERTLKYLGWGVNRATPLGWAFIILWIPVGILVYMWVESVVKSYGYSTSLSQNETSKKLVFVNQPIFDLFQAHGIDCQQQGEWIVFPKHAAKICGVVGREWEPKQGTYTVQLDVRVSLDSGHRIIEAFGGFGDTKEKAIADGIQNFTLNSFHVILASFFDPQDDQVTIEDWTIGGQERQVIIGPMGMRGTPPDPANPSTEWFKQFEGKLKAKKIPPGLHWIRVYYGQIDNQAKELEVLLDNEIWQEMQQDLATISWPKGKEFFSIRVFLVIKNKP